jgi:hypothetical protein
MIPSFKKSIIGGSIGFFSYGNQDRSGALALHVKRAMYELMESIEDG